MTWDYPEPGEFPEGDPVWFIDMKGTALVFFRDGCIAGTKWYNPEYKSIIDNQRRCTKHTGANGMHVNQATSVPRVLRWHHNTALKKRVPLTTVADILFGTGILAIGLKFPVYWDRTVYFPLYPNILDTLVLSAAGVYMLLRGWKHWFKFNWGLRDDSSADALVVILVLFFVAVVLIILVYVAISLSLRSGHMP